MNLDKQKIKLKEGVMEAFEQADMIFHDCEFAEYPNSVHAQFHQLCTLSNEIKSKMYLYHYSLNDKTFEELESEVLENGFAGLVKRRQEFIL
jgi:ribonuclease BN (tRNA processing enzyme)